MKENIFLIIWTYHSLIRNIKHFLYVIISQKNLYKSLKIINFNNYTGDLTNLIGHFTNENSHFFEF